MASVLSGTVRLNSSQLHEAIKQYVMARLPVTAVTQVALGSGSEASVEVSVNYKDQPIPRASDYQPP